MSATEQMEVKVYDRDGNTALHLAARDGYLAEARLLLRDGAPVNQPNNLGMTPLHFAARWSDSRMNELLLSNGAAIDSRDKDGETPLLTSIRQDGDDVAELLIGCGADVRIANRRGETALHFAALFTQGGKMVGKLISRGADVNARDWEGGTPLRDAVWSCNWEAACLLIAQGADVNARDKEGDTPLLKGGIVIDADMLELLIEAGADVNAVNKEGEMVLDYADHWPDERCRLLLIRSGARQHFRPLEWVQRMEWERKKDEEDERTGAARLQPFISAMFRGGARAVENLILDGADPNVSNQNGSTPLLCATGTFLAGGAAIMKVLIKHGADATARIWRGRTLVHELMTRQRCYSRRLRVLLDAGVDVNATDRDGQTALYITVSEGRVVHAKHLIRVGADVNLGDIYGYTPLHIAVRQGNCNMVRMLLARGADRALKDGRGWTPQARAESEGQADVLRILNESAK